MEKFKKLFNLSLNSSVAKPAVIGMIHLLPLPGNNNNNCVHLLIDLLLNNNNYYY